MPARSFDAMAFSESGFDWVDQRIARARKPLEKQRETIEILAVGGHYATDAEVLFKVMVEQAFVTSLIKSDGSILPFFERPIAAILAAMAIGALIWPVLVWIWRRIKGETPATASAR